LAQEHTHIKFFEAHTPSVSTLLEDYGVTKFPSFILFKSGQEVERKIGADEENLKQLIDLGGK